MGSFTPNTFVELGKDKEIFPFSTCYDCGVSLRFAHDRDRRVYWNWRPYAKIKTLCSPCLHVRHLKYERKRDKHLATTTTKEV